MRDENEDTVVLVASCDKYSDLWEPFFTLFFRYWPDCPYPVFLGSDYKKYDDSRITNITVRGDTSPAGWSAGVRCMLEHISQRYIILMLEDFLIYSLVDTEKIRYLVHYMRNRECGYIRIWPGHMVVKACDDNPGVGEIPKGTSYRICTQASVWDKELLLSLLRDGENIWSFEVNGSRRTDEMDDIFLTRVRTKPHPLTYYSGAVVGGKWMRDAVELCKREGIEVDLNSRKLESWPAYFTRVIVRKYRIGLALLGAKNKLRNKLSQLIRDTRIHRVLKNIRSRLGAVTR